MVTADRLETNHTFRLTLKPNRSISWKGNMLFLLLISTPILIIAFGFLYIGAPIILPFAGLEIVIVLIASYYVYQKSNKQEKKFWIRTIKELIHIVISSKGERVPVGDFLTEDDKKILIEKMDEIIREIRVI